MNCFVFLQTAREILVNRSVDKRAKTFCRKSSEFVQKCRELKDILRSKAGDVEGYTPSVVVVYWALCTGAGPMYMFCKRCRKFCAYSGKGVETLPRSHPDYFISKMHSVDIENAYTYANKTKTEYSQANRTILIYALQLLHANVAF